MKEALKHGKNAVITYLDAAQVLQPGIGAFDFPAFAIAPQLAFVLKTAVTDVFPVGNNQLCSPLMEAHTQGIRVIAPIGDDSLQMRTRPSPAFARNLHRCDRAFGQPALGQLRGRKLRSDRYAVAVDHHHALRTFPATGFADCRAPFLAATKVASRKASSQSSSRRWSSMDSSFCHALSQTPRSSQLRNRRQHVEPSGYGSGMSRHRAPVRSTHKMPSKHSRLPAQGRPRPSLRRLGSGNKGSRIFHCFSLNNSGGFLIEEAHQSTRPRHKSLT